MNGWFSHKNKEGLTPYLTRAAADARARYLDEEINTRIMTLFLGRAHLEVMECSTLLFSGTTSLDTICAPDSARK